MPSPDLTPCARCARMVDPVTLDTSGNCLDCWSELYWAQSYRWRVATGRAYGRRPRLSRWQRLFRHGPPAYPFV